MIVVVIILVVIGLMIAAHLKSNSSHTSSSQTVRTQAEEAANEAWYYHLNQALDETDRFIAGQLTSDEYQELARETAFTNKYVNEYCTPIFTWGYIIGQKYSMGEEVTAEEKRTIDANINKLTSELAGVMYESMLDNQRVVDLYAKSARACYFKGISAGEKQGNYVLAPLGEVSRSKGIVVQEANAFHCGSCCQVYFKRRIKSLPNQCTNCSTVFSNEDHIAFANLQVIGAFDFREASYELSYDIVRLRERLKI